MSLDERRDLIIPGGSADTIDFSIQQFLELAHSSIEHQGLFAVALSGGQTPKAIYQGVAKSKERSIVDWKRVLFFWSDERCVPLDHPDSNFRMAKETGLLQLVPSENVFPMRADAEDLEQSATDYENLLIQKLPGRAFDLVMLGMGEDGHTASLFPKTHGLHPNERLAIPNFIPEKEVWRLTLTFSCINKARQAQVYVLGKSKAAMVKKALTGPYEPDQLPVQRVGTPEHKALWILDHDAASFII